MIFQKTAPVHYVIMITIYGFPNSHHFGKKNYFTLITPKNFTRSV